MPPFELSRGRPGEARAEKELYQEIT